MSVNQLRGQPIHHTAFHFASYYVAILVMVLVWVVAAAIITTPAWLPGFFTMLLR